MSNLQAILAIGGVLLGMGVMVAALIVKPGRPPVLSGMHRNRPLVIRGRYGRADNPGHT